MKFLNKVKKIIPLGVMGLLVGGTLATTSLDLSSYPEPFIIDGQFDESTAIIVGSKAAASDTLGAISVATTLQWLSQDVLEIASTSTNGISKDVELGNSLNTEFTTPFKKTLKEFSVDIDGKNYDAYEEIELGDDLKIETSLTSNEPDYNEDVVIEAKKGDMRYNYVFKTSLSDDFNNIVSISNPAELQILGHKIRIIEADNNEFTAFVGDEYYMQVGDIVKVDDKEVTLINVGLGGSIVVRVDGELETIPSGNTEIVNGIEITNEETFYEESKSERTASLIIGTDSKETYEDGDAFIGEDEKDPLWIWKISYMNTPNPKISVINDFNYNDNRDDVVREGDSYMLPNNYFEIKFNSLTVNNYKDYMVEFEDSYDLSDVSGYGDEEDVVLLKSSGESFKIANKNSPEIILYNNSGNLDVFYKDNGDIVLEGSYSTLTSIAEIRYDDTRLDVKANTTEIQIGDSNDLIKIEYDTNGLQSIYWNTMDLSNKDEDFRTKYGVVLYNPDNAIEDNEFRMDIPADMVEAEIILGHDLKIESTEITVPKEIDIKTKLDTEVVSPTSNNLILVGGPCANDLVENFAEFPTCDEWHETYTDGEAIIKLASNGNNVALLVAGTNAIDTRMAAKVLANYEDYELESNDVLITGTLSNPVVIE